MEILFLIVLLYGVYCLYEAYIETKKTPPIEESEVAVRTNNLQEQKTIQETKQLNLQSQKAPRKKRPFERIKTDNCSYLCPSCRESTLRYISGKNGAFWGCNNYPSCTATYDDNNGKPILYEKDIYHNFSWDDYKEMMVKKWGLEKEEIILPPKYTKEDIYSLNWRQFEEWVTEVFKQHGYVAYATPPRYDGGKDVVAIKDGVKYFIECKHYQTEWIGREPLQKLIGAAVGESVHHVIFITTSNYHSNAIDYAKSVNDTGNMTIELWDTDKILEMANK